MVKATMINKNKLFLGEPKPECLLLSQKLIYGFDFANDWLVSLIMFDAILQVKSKNDEKV